MSLEAAAESGSLDAGSLEQPDSRAAIISAQAIPAAPENQGILFMEIASFRIRFSTAGEKTIHFVQTIAQFRAQ